MDISIVDFLLATLIYFFASLVQASVGIGGALIAAPLLILINPVFVPVPILLANIILTLAVAKKQWQFIHFLDLSYMISGRLFGTIPAVLIITSLYFDIVFAVVILIAVALSTLGWKIAINRFSLISAGLVSGFMGTLSSIGGPPVALAYQQVPKTQFVATMSMQLVIGGLISVLGIWITAGISDKQLLATAMLLPGMVAGYLAATKIGDHLNGRKIRYAVFILSGLAALTVLWKAIQ